MTATECIGFLKILTLSSLIFTTVVSSRRCPVLDLNFSVYGVDNCTRSVTEFDLGYFLENAECLGSGNWTVPAEIGCSHPPLRAGTTLDYPCKCDFGKQCKVLCKQGYQLAGVRNSITCQDNGTWTKLPECVPLICQQPKIEGGMIESTCILKEGVKCKVVCDEGYHLDGSPTVQCINRSIIGALPRCVKFCNFDQLPKDLEIDGTCSGKVGTTCKVTCKDKQLSVIGSPSVRCSSSGSGEWKQPFPTCGCSPLNVPADVKIKGICSFKVSNKCTAECADEYYARSGRNEFAVNCEVDGTWHKDNHCLKKCPTPELPSNVEMAAQECVNCSIKCKRSDEKMVPDIKSIKCQDDGVWSAVPVCVKNGKCADSLPNYVEFVGPCSYDIGVTCKVQCQDPDRILKSSHKTTCKNDQKWDPAPVCQKFCDPPDWPNSMPVPGSKCSRLIHTQCQWMCKPGYHPDSYFTIMCGATGQWSGQKPCVKMCPALDLPYRVEFDGPCISSADSVCKVKCSSQEYEPVPSANFTCGENGEWQDVPKCVRACNLANVQLPNDLTLGNCTRVSKLLSGDMCLLSCPGKRLPNGVPVLKCSDSGLSFPVNVRCLFPCKAPSLPSSLTPVRFGSCNSLGPKEHCAVQCSDGATLYGTAEVVCIGDDQFEVFPECRYECPPLMIHIGSYVDGPCSTSRGSTCTVKCADKSKTINGKASAIVRCEENLKWTSIDECKADCGKVVHDQSVKLKDKCGTNSGAICSFLCIPAKGIAKVLAPRDMTMKCQADGKWTTSPVCSYVCDVPTLPSNMILDKLCRRKINTWCEVTCKAPYKVSGGSNGNRIFCKEDGHWDSIPSCV